MEVKIKGFVIALLPLSSPSSLLRWYLEWKMARILGPALLDMEKAMHRAASAVRGLAEAMEHIDPEDVEIPRPFLEAFRNVEDG